MTLVGKISGCAYFNELGIMVVCVWLFYSHTMNVAENVPSCLPIHRESRFLFYGFESLKALSSLSLSPVSLPLLFYACALSLSFLLLYVLTLPLDLAFLTLSLPISTLIYTTFLVHVVVLLLFLFAPSTSFYSSVLCCLASNSSFYIFLGECSSPFLPRLLFIFCLFPLLFPFVYPFSAQSYLFNCIFRFSILFRNAKSLIFACVQICIFCTAVC